MLGTIWAFAYRHRETEKILCWGGRSQDLPNTDLASIPTSKIKNSNTQTVQQIDIRWQQYTQDNYNNTHNTTNNSTHKTTTTIHTRQLTTVHTRQLQQYTQLTTVHTRQLQQYTCQWDVIYIYIYQSTILIQWNMLKMSVLTKFSHLKGHSNLVKEVSPTDLTHIPLCLTIHAVNLSHSNA